MMVLFAGGPLHGQALAMPDDVPGVYAHDLPGELDGNWPPEPVLYRLGKVEMFGRVIRVGYLGAQPEAGELFDALTSSAGKAAEIG